MNIQRIFVYGASGHGKVVADILLARKDCEFAGFIDDGSQLQGASVLGHPVFGDGPWLQQESRRVRVRVALGVADNKIRHRLAEKCRSWGIEAISLVHPTASVSDSARLEPGTIVMAQAAINPNARIGRGAIVNTAAVVEHDVEIGEFGHVAPNSAMAGASRLGAFSMLGIGAVVIQCVRVGSNTIVGAGSVVSRDIGNDVVAYGVPARVVRSTGISVTDSEEPNHR